MAYHTKTVDLSKPYIGRAPTDEVVREQTMKYIRDDYNKNCGKMSQADVNRISDLLASGKAS